MRYQLVLQSQGDAFADFDQVIAVEDRLTEALGRSATVDGHYVGSYETEVFILTNHPAETFRQIRSVLQSMESLGVVTAAFHEVMRYQLVLHLQGDSFADFDQVIAVEKRLTKALGHSAIVDGHCVGSSGAEVFILTDHPEDTFQQIGFALQGTESLGAVTAAFHEVEEVDLL